jgi:hypothetical protein
MPPEIENEDSLIFGRDPSQQSAGERADLSPSFGQPSEHEGEQCANGKSGFTTTLHRDAERKKLRQRDQPA